MAIRLDQIDSQPPQQKKSVIRLDQLKKVEPIEIGPRQKQVDTNKLDLKGGGSDISAMGNLGFGIKEALAETPETVGKMMVMFGTTIRGGQEPDVPKGISQPKMDIGARIIRIGRRMMKENSLAVKKMKESDEIKELPQDAKFADQFMRDLGKGSVSLAASLAGGLTVGPVAVSAGFALAQAAEGTEEAKQAGKSDPEALRIGTALGIAEGTLEYVGLQKLLKVGGPGIKAVVRGAMAESLQEFSQTFAEGSLKTFFGLRDYNGIDSLVDIAGDSLYSASLGFILGSSASLPLSLGQMQSVEDELVRNGVERNAAGQAVDNAVQAGMDEALSSIEKSIDKPPAKKRENFNQAGDIEAPKATNKESDTQLIDQLIASREQGNADPRTPDGGIGRQIDHFDNEAFQDDVRRDGFVLPKETMTEALRRKIEDYNIRLKVFNREIENQLGEAVQEQHDLYAMKDMLPRVTADQIRRANILRDRLVSMVVRDGLAINDVDQFLHALHAQERNKRMNELRDEEKKEDGLSGMTDKESQEILDRVNKNTVLKAKMKKYVEFAKAVQLELLDMQVKEGLLSEQDKDTLLNSYEFYVPLFRDVGQDDFTGVGSGIDIKGAEVKRARGSKKRTRSILGNILAQRQRVMTRILKNRIGQSIVDLTERHPDLQDIFEINKQRFIPRMNKDGEVVFHDPLFKFGDDVIGTKIDGKQILIKINDKRLARALKNTDIVNVGRLGRAMRLGINVWSSMKTRWNPEFLVTNMQRDLGEALVNLGVERGQLGKEGKALRLEVAKNTFPNIRTIFAHLRGTELNAQFEEFLNLGGDTGHFWYEGVEKSEADLLSLERQIRNVGIQKVLNPTRQFFKMVDYANSAVELGVRFSTYKALVRRGMSKQKAIQSAADLTINFSRQGEISPLLKSAYGFIQPSIAGTSKVIRSMGSDQGARIQRTVAGLTIMGFMARMLSMLISPEEDEQIPDWKKNHKIVFANGPDSHISLWSLPYGYASFYSMGSNLAEITFGKKTWEEGLKSTLNTAVNAFTPFGVSVNDWLPTYLKPIVEVQMNKGWYDGVIRPPEFSRTPGPNHDNYFKSASDTMVSISKLLNKISGGSEDTSGLIDISPNDAQYYFDQYVGGPVTFVQRMYETAARGANGEFDATKTPFIRQVAGQGKTENWSYGVIKDTLSRVRKYRISDLEKNRFFRANDTALEQGIFDEKFYNKNTIDFLRGHYRIDGKIIDTKDNEHSKKQLDIIYNQMSSDDRQRLLNAYSERTRRQIERKNRQLNRR